MCYNPFVAGGLGTHKRLLRVRVTACHTPAGKGLEGVTVWFRLRKGDVSEWVWDAGRWRRRRMGHALARFLSLAASTDEEKADRELARLLPGQTEQEKTSHLWGLVQVVKAVLMRGSGLREVFGERMAWFTGHTEATLAAIAAGRVGQFGHVVRYWLKTQAFPFVVNGSLGLCCWWPDHDHGEYHLACVEATVMLLTGYRARLRVCRWQACGAVFWGRGTECPRCRAGRREDAEARKSFLVLLRQHARRYPKALTPAARQGFVDTLRRRGLEAARRDYLRFCERHRLPTRWFREG